MHVVPEGLSPSGFAKTWYKYQFSQAAAPPYACFRPPVEPPRAVPASLVDPLFGRFLDAAGGPLSELPLDELAAASAAAVALCDTMPQHFAREAARQDALLRILSALLDERVAEFSPSPASSGARTDGGLLVATGGKGSPMVDCMALLVEVKNELGARAGEPMVQGARTYELFWAEPSRASICSRAGACPCLLLEVVGPLLRVHALALLPGGGVLAEPLTAALNCLPLTGQPRALDALVATLAATRAAARELGALYRAAGDTAQAAPRSPVAGGLAGAPLLPWPLRDAAAWTGAAHLGGAAAAGKLLYVAHGAAAAPPGVPPASRVCVKFAPACYGGDVHAAWAAAGLAPALHAVERLPGGMHMVAMDLLSPTDGWQVLALLMPKSPAAAAARAAALTALAAAHSVALPGGATRAAHGDCRGANVFVRAARGGVTWEARFVDFDWSGTEGVARYPPLMSAAVPWSPGARPGTLLAQAHDTDLLTRA